jgi:hypothetical protein
VVLKLGCTPPGGVQDMPHFLNFAARLKEIFNSASFYNCAVPQVQKIVNGKNF